MKKIFLITFVLMMGFGLSACVKKTENNMAQIQKDIAKGKSIVCRYQIEGQETMAYFKDGKMRSEGNGFNSINDGTYMYTWQDGQNSGQKMSLASVENDRASREETAPTDLSKEELEDMDNLVKKMQDEMKAECRNESIDDNKFVAPQDIVWNDMDKFMQEMKEIQNKIDQGGAGSQDFKEMMNKVNEMMPPQSTEE